MTKTLNTAEGTLDYVEKSSQAMGKALELCEHHEKNAAEAATKIASVVSRLKKSGFIDEADEKLASQQLSSHSMSLDVLLNILDARDKEAAERQSKQANVLGEGVSDNTSGNGQSNDKFAAYAGRRRGEDDGPAESDKALLALIGK
jgi:hypothetical protein